MRLTKGRRAKFFHPGTFGVMHWGCVRKVLEPAGYEVRFDYARPTNGRRVFVVPENYYVPRLYNQDKVESSETHE